MKSIVLLSVVAALLLGACASRRYRETEVVVPSHDTVVRDQVPTESGRKVPVVDQH